VYAAGAERLQSDDDVVTHYVDLVCSIILESRTDFGRQWTQKEKMAKASLLRADGFLGLAKHRWTGYNWIYGDDILSQRRSMTSHSISKAFPPSLSIPMLTIIRPKGPGFY